MRDSMNDDQTRISKEGVRVQNDDRTKAYEDYMNNYEITMARWFSKRILDCNEKATKGQSKGHLYNEIFHECMLVGEAKAKAKYENKFGPRPPMP